MFVSGMYENKMTFKETINLIESFVESGEKLSFKGKYIADKHCIGGIPGNRTTPISCFNMCCSRFNFSKIFF